MNGRPGSPRVTVAIIAERENRYLMVEERIDGRLVLNQPAGHLEAGESLIEAVKRETLEETAWHVNPDALIGIYHWPHPKRPLTYLRFAFTGRLSRHEPQRSLDADIVRIMWLSPDEIRREHHRHRSPMVLACLQDHLAGRHFSLSCLREMNE